MNHDLDALGRKYHATAMTGRRIVEAMMEEVAVSFYATIETTEHPTAQDFFADAGRRLLRISEEQEPPE